MRPGARPADADSGRGERFAGPPPARVLVVDDQRFHREKLVRAVRSLGHEAEAVEGGAKALARLRAEPFDLVLLDLLMPDVDGFEVMAFMRRDRPLGAIPVIVVSALEGEMDAVVRAVEMGAEDVLPKRFDRVLLAARLDSALERRRALDAERERREHVRRLTDAASLMERDPGVAPGALLADTCRRGDAIGRLARVFVHMGEEVRARDARLRRQLARLRLVGLALGAGAVLGLAPPLARAALLEEPRPLGVALWLAALCTLLCLPAALWRGGLRRPPAGLGRLVLTLALAGALAGGVPVLWLARELPATVLGALLAAELGFALALSPWSRRHGSPVRRLLALALAAAAVWTLASGLGGLPPWSPGALALALVAPLGWAVCAHALARHPAGEGADRVDALGLVGLAALVATACLAPLAIAFDELVPLFRAPTGSAAALGGDAVGIVLVLLAAALAVGATLRVPLAREGGAEAAAAATLAAALAAVGWSVPVLGERVPPGLWVALALFAAALLVRLAAPRAHGATARSAAGPG